MKLPHDTRTTAGRPFIDLAPETAASILRTIAAGWARASKWPDVNVDAGEVVMTERLRDGMRAALAAGGLPWGGILIVLPGHGVPFPSGDSAAGRPDRHSDPLDRGLPPVRRA